MAFLSERRENDGRVVSQKSQRQMSLRSSGGRCQKSHAPFPRDQPMSRLPSLGARCHAPIAVPAMRPFERFISRRSRHERLLAVCTCLARRCRSFLSQSPFQSEALLRIEEAFLIPTNPTSSTVGRLGVGMAPSFTLKSKSSATPARRPCFASSIRACGSNTRQQEPRPRSNCLLMGPKSVDPSILLPNPAANTACPQHEPPGFM